MMAAYAVRADSEAPLNALVVGEIEPPGVPPGWVRVQVRLLLSITTTSGRCVALALRPTGSP